MRVRVWPVVAGLLVSACAVDVPRDATEYAFRTRGERLAGSDTLASRGTDSEGGLTDAAAADSSPVDVGAVADSGPVDSGPVDSGPVDSGPVDSGPTDSGLSDSGGGPDAGEDVAAGEDAPQAGDANSGTDMDAGAVADADDPHSCVGKCGKYVAGAPCQCEDSCEKFGDCCKDKASACPKKPECKTDNDCTTGDPCKAGTCDVNNGVCKVSPKAGCCSTGACCDTKTHTPWSKGTQCGMKVLAEEFECDGKHIKVRRAYGGCNGTDGECKADKGSYFWGPWAVALTCAGKDVCVQVGSATKCQTPPDCQTAAGCDDNNKCTKDTCSAAGKCAHEVIAGCCNLPSDCDDGNKCNIPLCNQNQCTNKAKPCEGTSACEVASCDQKTGACTVAIKANFCKIGGACIADGKTDDQDPCRGCVAKTSQTQWSLSAKCACKSGSCCDVGAGKVTHHRLEAGGLGIA